MKSLAFSALLFLGIHWATVLSHYQFFGLLLPS